jgi:hypothetical protein
MFSPEVEKLISIALIDGVITDKEKSVLIKKAVSIGMDADEFEMMLDAYLYEKSASSYQTPPEIPEKNGQDQDRCPSCNDFLPQFSTNCRSCGLELNLERLPSAISELIEKLKSAESEGNKKNSALLSAFSDDNQEFSHVIQVKRDIIINFIIPNSKSEMLSFLSMAIPYARKAIQNKSFFEKLLNNSAPDVLSEAWKIKCEQVIVQARFSMKDDQHSLKEINEYAAQLKIN